MTREQPSEQTIQWMSRNLQTIGVNQTAIQTIIQAIRTGNPLIGRYWYAIAAGWTPDPTEQTWTDLQVKHANQHPEQLALDFPENMLNEQPFNHPTAD